MFQIWRMSDSYIKYFNIMCIVCIVYKSTYKTNPKCTGIYTQQIHKISSYMFRLSMGATSGSLHSGLSYAFEIVCCMWHSHTLAHISNFFH